MATYTLFIGFRYTFDTTYLAQFYGSQSATLFEIIGDNGVLRTAYHGRNFTYASNGFFQSGTVTEAYGFTSDGRLAGQEAILGRASGVRALARGSPQRPNRRATGGVFRRPRPPRQHHLARASR